MNEASPLELAFHALGDLKLIDVVRDYFIHGWRQGRAREATAP